MHLGRRGGAMVAVDVGIDRMNIKVVGNSLSDCVNSYFVLVGRERNSLSV